MRVKWYFLPTVDCAWQIWKKCFKTLLRGLIDMGSGNHKKRLLIWLMWIEQFWALDGCRILGWQKCGSHQSIWLNCNIFGEKIAKYISQRMQSWGCWEQNKTENQQFLTLLILSIAVTYINNKIRSQQLENCCSSNKLYYILTFTDYEQWFLGT